MRRERVAAGAEREQVAARHGLSLQRTALEAKHLALGRDRSVVGAPVGWEQPLPGGAYQVFQRGSIYASAAGAFEVRGAIRGTWQAHGAEWGVLGYPVTDELPLGAGRVSEFQRGSVVWSPATGAHEVYGAIRQAWFAQGVEQGRLGYPVTGEHDVPGGRRSVFEGVSVTWDAASGRTEVRLGGP